MSASENDTFDNGPCPCGNSRIVRHVTSYDNPWSGADISYSIECQKCCSEWRFESHVATLLVRRSSEVEYTAALAEQLAASDELSAASQQLVSAYFAKFSAKNKKLEHAELERLGITSWSYRQYLAHRREGGTAATASFASRNTEWLLKQAAGESRHEEIVELLERSERANRATAEAEKKKERWKPN
jgi:hypothetical protein